MMIMIKLLAVLLLSASVASGSVGHRIENIKSAAPETYDYRIKYEFNAAYGYYSLWGYTASGGGIYEEIYFTDQSTYWRSTTSAFHISQFTFDIRIYKSTLNDARFSLIPNTSYYRYTAIDSYNFEFNRTDTLSRMLVNVIDSDIFITYKRSIDGSFTYPYNFKDYFIASGGVMTNLSNYGSADTTYPYFATYSVSTYIVPALSSAPDVLLSDTDGIYFKINQTTNIEGDDWWDIYNQGVAAGYDAGLNDGYSDGVIDGQSDNTGWQDAFVIIKGAIDTVGNVLSIELFGFFTIGTLVSIPIVVGLLFWIIEKWRGS